MAIIPAKQARAKVQEAFRAGVEANLPAARNEFARQLDLASAEGRMNAQMRYTAADLSPAAEVAAGQLEELRVTVVKELEDLGYQVKDSRTHVEPAALGRPVTRRVLLTVEY
jgi:hypothetical protein